MARKNPFVGRLTRAYLKFEVKDGAPIPAFAGIGIYDVEIGQVRFRWRRRLRRSMILEFKDQIGFSAAVR